MRIDNNKLIFKSNRKMSQLISLLSLLCLIHNEPVCSTKIEDISICLNETDCDETTEFKAYTQNIIEEENSSVTTPSTLLVTSSTAQINTTLSTKSGVATTTPIPPHNNELKNQTVHKIESDICECDLTVSSCDINCCCDKDCKEYQLTTFSHCKDSHADLYDSRYCYNRNFIDRNNTPFILEKLANNLFCILYDNLPPTYSTNNDLHIENHKELKAAIKPNKLMWKWEYPQSMPEYNKSSPYQDGDIIWKLEKNIIKPIELLQTGFTGLCSFKKTLKYLRDWKDHCMQTELHNKNVYLFPMAFNNFTIISSLLVFNKTYTLSTNQECPKNICIPLTNHYCQNSWNICNNTEISGNCFDGICKNIVLGVKYVIIHNGSMGINNINVYFNMGNVSSKFYQHFEVVFEWNGTSKEKVFTLSGNPGYIRGKPLIIGALYVNKTNNVESRYVIFNKTDSFLTLPLSQRNGECSQSNRYTIAFGEDVKLKCSVFLEMSNFSTTSCIELQNRTLQLLLRDSLFNITQTDQYKVYVSKLGNFTHNDTSSWVQILLDRIPQNVITGQLINDQLHCSGLVTSMRIDVLYATLSKPETLTNHNVLGIGYTFSDEIDISWPKCTAKNCVDILELDVISYVSFHDVSKPSKYYFVGGPNLDITLPYDFFYPFLSNSVQIQPLRLLIVSIICRVLVANIFLNIP